jgi:predicted homoserine dehydrogenase-like protein
MRPALVVARNPRAAVDAYRDAEIPETSVVLSEDRDVLATALAECRPAATSRVEALTEVPGIDVVVEATGSLGFGARTMLGCLEAGVPVVSINAEVDATIGYLLHSAAKAAGTVYTICDGDQPGVLLRQLDFVNGMGFETVAAVNCKRHLDIRQTPSTSAPFAARDGTSLAVTTAAGDGTKMQIENAVVANAAGLPPDKRGMHGIVTTLADAVNDVVCRLARHGVVEYTLGGDFGAGVFVIGRAPDPDAVRQALRFFKMGEGPFYLFFRPFHLVHLEMPLTIAEVILDGTGLARHSGPPVADVVAVAKRDLKAGEALDGIGGSTCYGQIDTVRGAEGCLPIAFSEHARLRRDTSADHPIQLESVELDEDDDIVRLRRLQDTCAFPSP